MSENTPAPQPHEERVDLSPAGALDDALDGALDAASSALPAAAIRALAEAEERRQVERAALPKELGGREGLEPVRYGDWEKKGLAVDF